MLAKANSVTSKIIVGDSEYWDDLNMEIARVRLILLRGNA